MENLNQFEAPSYEDLNKTLVKACEMGHLEIVKYLLTSPEIKQKPDIHTSEDAALKGASYNGHLEIVQYLLTSPELTEHAKIKKSEGSTLSFTAMHGHLDVVKYLLTDPLVKNQSDIRADGDNALSFACYGNHVDVVNYLLTSPEVTERPLNINFGLKCAVSLGNMETTKYLIFDYGIELTPELKKQLKNKNNKDLIPFQEVLEMFKERDNQLAGELTQQSESLPQNKKLKK